MNEASEWKIAKWPFLTAYVVLHVVAGVIAVKMPHPISQTEIILVVTCVVVGAFLGCLPFILEYRAVKKLIEVNAVTTVAEQLHDLKTYSAQVAAATDQWARVQETTKGNADKTVGAAKEIAERMTEEIREFNEFQVKLNDTEKGALRLEVEKLRRGEGEWLQVVVRILDHIFALHNAAVRSGQPDLADQIGNFQNACRDAARRVGVTPYSAAPEEKFDAQKFRAHGVETPPADAVIAETLAPGLTFQGRLIRPALVRLHDVNAPEVKAPEAPAPAAEAVPEKPGAAPESGQLALEAE
ncbi:MAG: nucleotide exchange factor GrpE [Verrucomicrobiae bacterium]|nr:nucleotide exchange factor GrpE [Verrucomicrobiae bacterium]